MLCICYFNQKSRWLWVAGTEKLIICYPFRYYTYSNKEHQNTHKHKTCWKEQWWLRGAPTPSRWKVKWLLVAWLFLGVLPSSLFFKHPWPLLWALLRMPTCQRDKDTNFFWILTATLTGTVNLFLLLNLSKPRFVKTLRDVLLCPAVFKQLNFTCVLPFPTED